MAEKLDEFDFTTKRGPGRPSKYPWETWLDGGIYKLKRGEDYEVMTSSFKSAAKSAAKTRGQKLRFMPLESGSVLVIQAYKEN